jgi:hypothetical protein
MPIMAGSDYIREIKMTSESERSNGIEGVAPMEAVDRIVKTDVSPEITESKGGSSKRSWKEALVHEVRTHPFGYVVLGLFVVAGPILAPMLFPQAPPAAAAVGGLAFGLYAALCAVPQKFL